MIEYTEFVYVYVDRCRCRRRRMRRCVDHNDDSSMMTGYVE